VPQDAPYASAVPVAVAVPAEKPWSGKRTAAVAAIALALTSAGAITAAAASPNGITPPSDQRNGRGFGPGGGGPNRQFAPGGGGPGQQQAPGQQQPGQHQPGQQQPGQGLGPQPRGQR
jgi:hypothetical protein